ncbi:uncharacterized protein [Haliotis cracherodii]
MSVSDRRVGQGLYIKLPDFRSSSNVSTSLKTFHLLLKEHIETFKMQKLVIAVLLVFSLVVMEVTCQDAMLAPPDRPSEFRSPDQLRQYLKALNEYYAIVGRPRFGRSVNKRSVNDAVFGEATKTE